MTWINTDSDGAHYILSAKYMGVAHNTSAPLFLLLGRLFLWLPIGSEAWRMGIISVLATTVAAIFIYKVVKVHLEGKSRWYALIASVIYGGSALVITQSTIIETYALSTCLSVMAYYFCIQKRWLVASIMMGLVIAIHPLFFLMTWFVLVIAYKELRTKKLVIITWAFLLFYLYIPITNIYGNVPSMWGNTSAVGFLRNNFGTMWMLAGGLSLYDIPKRVIDTISIMGISMGVGLIVVVSYFIKQRTWRSKLLWLFVIPIFYFIINLSAETYVYMIPSIAFGSIAVGIALSKLKLKYVYATGIVAIVLMSFNANYMDIGRTLDPNMSAQEFYDNELPKIEDGGIFLGGGWTWAIVYLYNKEEGRNIIPICTDILPSQEYLDNLEANGIKLTRTDSESFIDKQWVVAQSIVEQNDNVWIAKEINPARLEYDIVPAGENMDLITRWLGYNKQPEIAWKPSNPYAFITGALEVGEWKFILKSNHNARFAMEWIIFSLGFYWFIIRLFRRKEDVSHKEKDKDTIIAR
jgi:hypothetical protein